jgi:hypothetical protein
MDVAVDMIPPVSYGLFNLSENTQNPEVCQDKSKKTKMTAL